MPWKVINIVNERMRFVLRLEDGERMSELCREFGISRKTGYKIYSRFQDLGPAGLYDESRAPKRQWQQTPPEIEDLIVKLRKRHVTWGPKKLKAYLERKRPGLTFPAQSTISQILKRRGLISPRYRGRKRHAYPSSKLSKSYAPNEIWCADFKGHQVAKPQVLLPFDHLRPLQSLLPRMYGTRKHSCIRCPPRFYRCF